MENRHDKRKGQAIELRRIARIPPDGEDWEKCTSGIYQGVLISAEAYFRSVYFGRSLSLSLSLSFFFFFFFFGPLFHLSRQLHRRHLFLNDAT